MSKKIISATLCVVGALAISACAELKSTGKTIGHATKDVTTSIGHASRDTAKTIGKSAKKVVKDVSESKEEE